MMSKTLESFVDKLRVDGVEAGRRAAEQIVRDAEQQSRQLLRDAEVRANEILEAAKRESDKILARTQTELTLAARATVARLREALSQAATAVLARGAGEKLEDPEFLGELIRDVVVRYAEADAVNNGAITINVSEAMRHRLTDWVIRTFRKETERLGVCVDFHGALCGAGFEYRVSDGTVEITSEAVVRALSDIVRPEFRELIASAVDGKFSDPRDR